MRHVNANNFSFCDRLCWTCMWSMCNRLLWIWQSGKISQRTISVAIISSFICLVNQLICKLCTFAGCNDLGSCNSVGDCVCDAGTCKYDNWLNMIKFINVSAGFTGSTCSTCDSTHYSYPVGFSKAFFCLWARACSLCRLASFVMQTPRAAVMDRYDKSCIYGVRIAYLVCIVRSW
jgi:hypothetical protein